MNFKETKIRFRLTSERFEDVCWDMRIMSDSAADELQFVADSLDVLKQDVLKKLHDNITSVPYDINVKVRKIPREDD